MFTIGNGNDSVLLFFLRKMPWIMPPQTKTMNANIGSSTFLAEYFAKIKQEKSDDFIENQFFFSSPLQRLKSLKFRTSPQWPHALALTAKWALFMVLVSHPLRKHPVFPPTHSSNGELSFFFILGSMTRLASPRAETMKKRPPCKTRAGEYIYSLMWPAV